MLDKCCFIHQSYVTRSGEFGKCFEAESDDNGTSTTYEEAEKYLGWRDIDDQGSWLKQVKGSCSCVCVCVRTFALIEKKCLTPLKLVNNSCFSDFWRRKEETSNDWLDLVAIPSLFENVLFLLAPVFPC